MKSGRIPHCWCSRINISVTRILASGLVVLFPPALHPLHGQTGVRVLLAQPPPSFLDASRVPLYALARASGFRPGGFNLPRLEYVDSGEYSAGNRAAGWRMRNRHGRTRQRETKSPPGNRPKLMRLRFSFGPSVLGLPLRFPRPFFPYYRPMLAVPLLLEIMFLRAVHLACADKASGPRATEPIPWNERDARTGIASMKGNRVSNRNRVSDKRSQILASITSAWGMRTPVWKFSQGGERRI